MTLRPCLLAALLLSCSQPSYPCAQIGLVEQAYGDALLSLSLLCGRCRTPQLLPTNEADPAMVLLIGSTVRLAYDRGEIERIADQYGYPASVGIFAHELGHLVDMSEAWPSTEPSADMWAGCGLAIAGLPTEPLESYLAAEASESSATHPGADVRIDAVRDGHKSCAQIWED